jgi:ectoine hydroxylase-related dioxygenase (phytanoyl-CoA dioxygenase family)
MAARIPTDQQVAAFRRDGAVFLPGFLAPELVEQLAQGVERDLAEPGPLAITMAPADGSGQFVEDFCRWGEVSEYRTVVEASGMGRAAAELMGSGEVRLFHDHMLVKEAGSSIRTPWHQDQPYYCIDGLKTVSFWIPLDPVSRAATPEFVAGTHGGNWFMPRSFLAGNALVFDEGTLEEVPDVEADRDAFPILGWEMQPGDAVAFNMLTLHAAGPADSRRRAVSFRLIGDDVRYGPRPHRTSPPFPGLDEELEAGEPMRVDRLFPLLYP